MLLGTGCLQTSPLIPVATCCLKNPNLLPMITYWWIAAFLRARYDVCCLMLQWDSATASPLSSMNLFQIIMSTTESRNLNLSTICWIKSNPTRLISATWKPTLSHNLLQHSWFQFPITLTVAKMNTKDRTYPPLSITSPATGQETQCI